MAVATMRVPTIFTAVDKFSDVVSRMTAGTTKFSKTASSAVMRVDNKVNGLWNSMNNMSQLAIGGGLGGLFYYAGKDIKDFEVKIASLSAVTGTKIGSMNSQIESLGKSAKMSVIDVAGAFEIVGSKMSQYLDNPEALKSITDASITLSRAARMELEPAISSLTTMMNVYQLSAEDAANAVNKLSAGETVGSKSIAETASIIPQFGAQAVRANVNLQESIALVQTLAQSLPTEGIGRGLRNILFDISSTKTWDKNRWKAIKLAGIDFEFVTNNANKLVDRLRELKKLESVKGGTELFFKRVNSIAANTLFQNFDNGETSLVSFLDRIDELNDAADKASKNTSTLSAFVDKLKASFTNFIVTNNNSNSALSITKSILGWMTDNMGNIINLIGSVVVAFIGWKAIVGIVSLVSGTMAAYTSVMKAHTVITQIATFRGWGYVATLRAVALAQLAAYWPALLIVGALGLLAYAFWDTGKSTDSMVTKQVTALDKGNLAWRKATRVQAEEMAKQRKLMEKPKIPVSKERTKMHDILVAEEKRQAFANALKPNNLPKINESIARKLYENRQMEAVVGKEKATTLRNQGFTFEEFQKVYPNVAGYSDRAATDKKGEITIILKGNTEGVSSVSGSGDFVFNGIPARTTSTKLPSKRD